MSGYKIDGLPLTEEEVHRHRGSCNAALNAFICRAAENEDTNWDFAAAALMQADDVVREYRKVIASQRDPLRPAPTGMFFLKGPWQGTLDQWIQTHEPRHSARVALVRALREAGAELTPFNGIAMVDLAPVKGEDVYLLAKIGILREATSEECQALGVEAWTTRLDDYETSEETMAEIRRRDEAEGEPKLKIVDGGNDAQA